MEKRKKYNLWRALRNKRGSATAEFAMIVPLLIIFLAVVMDFGRLMLDYQAANKSTRDASRYLSRVGVTCAGGVGTIDNAGDVTIAKNLALSGSIDAPAAPADYLLAYWTDPNSITVTIACVDNTGSAYSGLYSAIDSIPTLTVTSAVPFSLFFGNVFFGSETLSFYTTTNMVWMQNG